MKLSKKTWIAILCIFLALMFVLFYMMVKQQGEARVNTIDLDNGDRISFQKTENYTSATEAYDERYTILTDLEFEKKFPSQGDNKTEVTLPEKLVNERHCYQLKKDRLTGDFDEIYQWETGIYKDAKSEILSLVRNMGNQKVVADRGYMELSFYKETPQRLQIKDGSTLEEIRFVKSVVNEKKVRITQVSDESNADKKSYLAEIRDINGKGTDAFFLADNVTQDYFIAALETLVGRNYTMPDDTTGSQKAKADSPDAFAAAKKEIAYRQAAEERVFYQHIDEIKASELGYELYTTYYPLTKKKDGKVYNVHCTFFIYGEKTWDEYLYLEQNKDGVFTEKA